MINVIEVENLSYRYPDGTQALQNINLGIARGERVALMGANGSGKSTFFLCLNGILKPSQGRVIFGGKPVGYGKQALLDLRRQVGIVFQDPDTQLFSAGVYEEISFGPFNLGLDPLEVKNRVDQAIADLGIETFKEKPVHFLSGGQKKRVAIADILVMEPEVMILDEPAAALDPKHGRMMDGILEELSRRGITVLISTHDVDRALRWADRIVVFDEGKILCQGRPLEVFLDKGLLDQACLEQPAVLRIFLKLQSLGLLGLELAPPKSLSQLEERLANIKGRP